MKKVEFSNIQRKAIETRNTDILVSAGAGSGKTTVLVERVLNLIAPRNDETPINIDRLLVVTFTDAAAQHMKDGVATALNRRIKENPNDENLKKQLALINKSNITTIHSFCLMVARKFFHKIDMESNFKVADTAEISLLKSEILDDLFEENYQKHYEGGGNINFIRLAQMFDQRVGDSNFRQAVLDLHEYALSASNPEGWLTSCAAEYLINDGLEHSKWYQYFIYDMQQKIDAIIDAANKALELAEYPYINTKYHDIISQEIEYINKVQIALSTDFESFCNSLNFSFDRFPGGRQKSFDDIDPDEIKAVRENITSARNIYKKNIAGIKNMIVKGSQGIENDLKNLYEIMLELTQIVSEFARRFRQEKKERGRADFNDFEHFALQILVDTFDDVGNAVLSKEAEEIGAMFDEVFIDEYQDSSLIQEAILNAVVKSGKINRFMVGDVKQCIYQFRMARPSIFTEKHENFVKNNTLGVPISLMDNYRSRQNIIDTVNFLFEKLMSKKVGGVDYYNGNALNFAAKYPCVENLDFKTVLHILDRRNTDGVLEIEADDTDDLLMELSQAEAEAKITANHIAELFNCGFMVKDGGNVRPIRCSDIVILLRSKTAIQAFVDELRNLDIPAFSETADDYFLATEVMVILSILQIIDNPRQDIPLITVLHSEIFQFTADELVAINKFRANSDFYTALAHFANETSPLSMRVQSFLNTLNKWRKIAGFVPISQLIFRIYEETDYLNFVGLLPGGKLRRANLMLLFEKATHFEQASYSGLFNFVRYIEKLQRTKFNLEKANVSNENEDLVRIMTIHKSKGLEFPVVFLCQAGKQFNLMDTKRNLVMDYDLGIGLKSLDFERNISSQTFSRAVISSKITAGQIAEELRILYVALTRAKEKLYIIGSSKNPDKYAESDGMPSAYDVAAGRSYLDWILMTMGKNAPQDIWNVILTNIDKIRANAEKRQKKHSSVFDITNQTSESPEILRQLSYNYPYASSQFIPAKMSVSEIKRLYFNEFLRDSLGFEKKEHRDFASPAFVQDVQSPISSTNKGIIVHTVLEHIDFHKPETAAISALIDNLIERKLLTTDEAKIVPIEAIVDFLKSTIAEQIKIADIVQREIPFAISMPPSLINSSFAGAIDDMVVHGVIDCIFATSEGLFILDYKTEKVHGDIRNSAEKYRTQMELYQIAAEKIFNKKVCKKVIYFFDKGQAVVL